MYVDLLQAGLDANFMKNLPGCILKYSNTLVSWHFWSLNIFIMRVYVNDFICEVRTRKKIIINGR